jgi:hypothetical protein
MEYTLRRTVQIELEGVAMHVDVVTDSTWDEWYEEAIRVDDSERDISGLIDRHAPGLLEEIERAVDVEIRQLIQERAMSWMA